MLRIRHNSNMEFLTFCRRLRFFKQMKNINHVAYMNKAVRGSRKSNNKNSYLDVSIQWVYINLKPTQLITIFLCIHKPVRYVILWRFKAVVVLTSTNQPSNVLDVSESWRDILHAHLLPLWRVCCQGKDTLSRWRHRWEEAYATQL